MILRWIHVYEMSFYVVEPILFTETFTLLR